MNRFFLQPLPRSAHLAGIGALLLINGLAWRLSRSLRPVPLPRNLPPAQREPGRRIPFDGPGNLRDLGGYIAADGRRVRWGALYRSDHLGRLSRRDLRQIPQLELTRLIDFRSRTEKAADPNRLPRNHTIRIVELPIFDDDASSAMGTNLRTRIMRGDVTGLAAADMLIAANQQLVTEFTPVYRRFIHELLAAHGAPVLFHCTAGKDRTGFAAAIVLRLLGVPETQIMADYLRSHEYSLATRRHELRLVRVLKGAPAATLVRDLLGVEAAYLQAAFAAIDQHYGSFDAYACDGLGLSPHASAQLRDTLLER